VIVGLGVVVALSCNVLRIFILTWIHAVGGSEAFDRWHETMGWVEVVTGLSVVLFIARTMRNDEPRGESLEEQLKPETFPLGLVFFSIGFWCLSAIGTEQWYARHERNLGDARWWKVMEPAKTDPDFVDWQRVEIPEESRALLRTNDGLALQWKGPDTLKWRLVYLQWPAARASASSAALHHPDICLPAVGYQLIKEEPMIELMVQGKPMRFHHYLFSGNLHPMQVFYTQMEQGASHQGDWESVDRSIFGRVGAAWAGRRSRAQAVLQISVTGAGEIPIRPLEKVLGKLVSLTTETTKKN
jgi:hypothetical protein